VPPHFLAPAPELRAAREALHSAMGPQLVAPRKTVVFLARGEHGTRYLIRQKELMGNLSAVARSAGLQFVVHDGFTMPVKEAAYVFANAAAVVGVHGASFANVIFCESGALVVELSFRSVYTNHYEHAAAALGLKYAAFPLVPSPRGVASANVTAPPGTFEAIAELVSIQIADVDYVARQSGPPGGGAAGPHAGGSMGQPAREAAGSPQEARCLAKDCASGKGMERKEAKQEPEQIILSPDVDRIQDTARILEALAARLSHSRPGTSMRVLDIGGNDFYGLAVRHGWSYETIDLEAEQEHGTGGHRGYATARVYDGRNLPFEEDSFDVVIIGFVLHHAADNTLHILKQVRSISTSFVVVGEDLASHAHPLVWHQRNFDHHPGGIFRSDEEWRQLFELVDFQHESTYVVKNKKYLFCDELSDADYDARPYRVMYLLRVHASGDPLRR